MTHSSNRRETSPIRPAYSQLWSEEIDEIYRLGLDVQRGGTIVEIGTAQGGSSAILHRATRGRRIRIYSYDPFPNAEARAHLADTDVVLLPVASTAGATAWRATQRIDLLFIDGSHHLIDVVSDFNAWRGFLAERARVAFHDYDSPERGGLIHLGVKVALDAILSGNTFSGMTRVGRLLSGNISGETRTVTAADCRAALVSVGASVSALLTAPPGDATFVGESGTFYDVLLACLGLSSARRADAIPASDECVLIFRRPLGDPAPDLLLSGRPFRIIDNLMLCYLVESALSDSRRDCILSLCRDRKAFYKWEEVLDTLNHAQRQPRGIRERLALLPEGQSLESISAFVASEQVRLVCLTRIFSAVTGVNL